MNKMNEGSGIGLHLTKESELDEVLQTLADKDDWKIKQRVSVTHIDLKPLYMKIQKKTTLASEQRIEDGIVHFTVNANVAQIAKVRAYVQHYMDWMIEGSEEMAHGTSEKGRSELETKVVGQKMTDYYYVTDLDSVYCTEQGKKVYGLNKNHGENMNNWFLFIEVELIDQTTDEFFFGPFRLKTKPVKKSRREKRAQ